MAKKLKIVQIASEVAPFAKSGGLAEVTRSLPKALKRAGHDLIVIMPFYPEIIEPEQHGLKQIFSDVEVYLNSEDAVRINYWRGYLMKGLPIYFIENKKYFPPRKSLYGSSQENARFLVFDVAALKLISLLKFEADVVHCHDWHSGLIPFYLKTDFRYSRTLRNAVTIFTIHNLAFQFGRDWWEISAKNKDYGRGRVPHLSDPKLEYINFAKRAILSADFINTVSEHYREEIMTKKFGQDLHRILKNREDKLYGIVNGIDYRAYNPNLDPGLAKNYNYLKISDKAVNKGQVQKLFKLAIAPKTPLFCTTSRVTFQKGFELILEIAEPLLRQEVQLIIIGSGDKNYINQLLKIEKKFRRKLAVIPSHEENQKYETLIYAGADFILLPSHHEPCGINQLIAMRYGCIPIVRKVGGLYDTVENFHPATKRGTGFSFVQFDAFALYGAIIRALEIYKCEDIRQRLVARVMQESNSWEIPAAKYIALYRQAIRNHVPRPVVS
ncbi:MAG: glycogen synthase [Planctomycetes bacterium]|jgi:starch synthase|nr:glycogen synthase [Planctomycetota bacterium]